jgi:hypothetical protein
LGDMVVVDPVIVCCRSKSIAKEIREEERRHAEELKARAALSAEKEKERVEELLRP